MTLLLALDQNFPVPLLRSIERWLPSDVTLRHLTEIDARLSDLSDRELFIALHQLSYDGLVTNNWRMLNIEHEVAAIVATRATVVATKGMGDDAIRPAGALLLELPGLAGRLNPKTANVIVLTYQHRKSESGWEYLTRIANRQDTTAAELWAAHRPSAAEMTTPVLP